MYLLGVEKRFKPRPQNRILAETLFKISEECSSPFYLGFCRATNSRPHLFKSWITLSTGQITIQWIAWFVLLTFIHWIVIYPVDSVIQPWNNWGLMFGKRNVQQSKIKFRTYLSSRTDIISPDLNVSSLSSTASKSYNARTFWAST